ncbi:MAG: LapA family protein [Sphingomonadaceae bacterium]
MQFLRTVFWVILAVVGVIFTFNNWQIVSIRLWGDIIVDTPLPLLLFIVFMLGLLPILLWHRATHWSLKRRLDAANRSLAETRAASEPLPRADAIAPVTMPIGSPGGVA